MIEEILEQIKPKDKKPLCMVAEHSDIQFLIKQLDNAKEVASKEADRVVSEYEEKVGVIWEKVKESLTEKGLYTNNNKDIVIGDGVVWLQDK